MSLFTKLVVATLPFVPKRVVGIVAQRYIAGPLLDDAIRTTKELMALGASATIDVLGELVDTRERAETEAAVSASVVKAIGTHSLDSYLSVKISSLGVDVDQEMAYSNLATIVRSARDIGVFVRLDMENSPYTDTTIRFYRRLRSDGFENVGIVIQAYLKRSRSDVESLLPLKPSIRLCKGIYIESEEIAYRGADEIRKNFKALLRQIEDGGGTVKVATHDDALINDAIQYFAEKGQAPSTVEFQMLLGVTEKRRDALIALGYRVRIYVPFGEDWYGYSVRRLIENPMIAGHVAKAILTRK